MRQDPLSADEHKSTPNYGSGVALTLCTLRAIIKPSLVPLPLLTIHASICMLCSLPCLLSLLEINPLLASATVPSPNSVYEALSFYSSLQRLHALHIFALLHGRVVSAFSTMGHHPLFAAKSIQQCSSTSTVLFNPLVIRPISIRIQMLLLFIFAVITSG
jgi:hypothetical protein